MIFDVLFIVLGVFCVLKGADWLTEGASAIARRMNVPEMIIGLTIVAAGTSAPELFVSLVSALKGTSDMAVGNVVGSNIMNTMLIVGCAALVAPMTISRSTVKKDIPFSIAASVLLLLLSVNGDFSRLDGILLLLGFASFMTFTLLPVVKPRQSSSPIESNTSVNPVDPTLSKHDTKPLWRQALAVVIGLALLVVGSNLFVDSASRVAYFLGVSEGVVGLTVVAGGTSLPELATSVVAARKGQSAIAIGNVIGSNVFNILLILGLTATISPLQIEGITTIDMAVMLLSVALVWLFSRTRYTVERWEGAVLVFGYLAYLVWLIANL
jgi:cation:H+ antiporter